MKGYWNIGNCTQKKKKKKTKKNEKEGKKERNKPFDAFIG